MKWRVIGLIMLMGSAPSWAVQSPQDLVQQTAEQMLDKLRTERQIIDAHPGRIYELVNKIVLPHFDFERMSRWVLGRYWRTATSEVVRQ